MKFFQHTITAITLSVCATTVFAADDIGNYSIADAMQSENAKNILGTNIKFYFGDQPHGTITKEFVEHTSRKKTNGSNKSDKEACEWALLSNLKEFKEDAEKVGANAVVNIRSKYKNNITSSTETFKCASGMLMSDVSLVGDIVTIKE